jgi:hypothetical protein
MTPVRVFVQAVALLALGSCAAAPPARVAPAAAGPAERRFYSAADRVAALRSASIFAPRAVADADIVAGPPQKSDELPLGFNDKVTCTFAVAGEDKGGTTPKFDCVITRVERATGEVQVATPETDEEPVKVKFGRDNRETFSEVAATRLLWALGFYADAMFPVRLTCADCPENPVRNAGPRAPRTFGEAVVERKAPGRRMYEIGNEDQGWSWKELGQVSAPGYQKDGLRLLAAFLKHGDNKPAQQRLVCDGVAVDESVRPFRTTCTASRMLVQDLGATFGGAGRTTNGRTAKMNLEEWSAKPVWKKAGTAGRPADCQAELTKSFAAKDGLEHPPISEEGRRFAAGLLCQLSDAQLTSLFTVARVAELPDYRNADGSLKAGLTEPAIVARWVAAFREKREAVAAARCRPGGPPPDPAAIDNPMGLPVVPNFCRSPLL